MARNTAWPPFLRLPVPSVVVLLLPMVVVVVLLLLMVNERTFGNSFF